MRPRLLLVAPFSLLALSVGGSSAAPMHHSTATTSGWIIPLACLAAVFDLFGTFTVLRSFWRTAQVAKEIRRVLAPSVTAEGIVASTDTYFQAGKYGSLLRSIADRIGWDWWTLAGLLGYFLGTGFGLWAAILAVKS